MATTKKKRAMTAEDLFNIALVSDPRPSPDGTLVAYVVTHLDKIMDDYRASIAIVPTSGGTPRMLTSGISRDTHPRWSPDGSTIAFVSNRTPLLPADGEISVNPAVKHPPQVWTIAVDTGEVVQVTTRKAGASAPEWSPDGNRLAFLSSVDAAEDRNRGREEPAVADERVIDRIRYRADGRGFIAGKYSHLFVVDATGGKAKQLTFGDMDDSQPAWSPNGREIAFVANRTQGRQLNEVSAIYAVPAAGGKVRPIAEDEAEFHSPVWSPDGKRIAFSGYLGTHYGSITRLWSAKANGTDRRCHTAKVDVSFTDEGMSDLHVGADQRVAWSADGKHLMSLVSQGGSTSVERVSVATGKRTQVVGGKRRVSGMAITGKQVVVVAGSIDRPFELFTASITGQELRQLTRHNAAWLREVTLASAEEVKFKSERDAMPLQGWLLRPPGGSTRRKLPLIVQIHGGPHAMYGYGMFHEMQLMAARGFAVFFSNPRGSAGYGSAFATCTRGDWGFSDMDDIMSGVDAVVAGGGIDPTRIGVTGGSYGGYLTNWIVGHTNRFKAAVTQRCVSNLHSMYGTSDIGFDFGEHEFGGTPWGDADLLLRQSPIQYVDKIRTPLLIIHNEGDLRCPIEQAEQLFTALKRLGRTTRFVRIPEEDHNLSRTGKPSRRLARLHHLVGWFEHYL